MAFVLEGEDDFPAGVELEGDQDLVIASRDFEKLAESRSKSGFVEGVEAGKREGLQEGFNSGFSRGLVISSPWAILKGNINSVMVYCQRKFRAGGDDCRHGQEFLPRLQALLKDLEESEAEWKKSQIPTEKESYQIQVAQTTDRESEAEWKKSQIPKAYQVEKAPDVTVAMETDTSVGVRYTDEPVGTTTGSDVTVAMETDTNIGVTYGELVGSNTKLPAAVERIKEKLEHIRQEILAAESENIT